MANQKSVIQIAKDSGNIRANIDYGELEAKVSVARFNVVSVGNESTGDHCLLLDKLPADWDIIPEECRIRQASTGPATNFTARLETSDANGVPVSLTATSAAYQAGSAGTITFATDASQTSLASVLKGRPLRLKYVLLTALPAGAQFAVDVAYRKKRI